MHKWYILGTCKYVVHHQYNYNKPGPGGTRLRNHTHPTVPNKRTWKRTVVRKKRGALRESNSRPRTQLLHDSSCPNWDAYIRVNRQMEPVGTVISTKKRKQHPSRWDDASTADAAPGTVGRGKQREARRANSTPSGWWISCRARAFTAQNRDPV